VKFIKDVFVLLRDTTWPTRKERWTDFLSVMEYTAFFAVVIYIFDKVVASGLFRIINMFS
jgi:preprotein translocase, secE subunit